MLALLLFAGGAFAAEAPPAGIPRFDLPSSGLELARPTRSGTFFDVVGRYLLNKPIRGAFEITELGLLVLIFAGLPLVSHADEHVTMDFIDRILPARIESPRVR